MSKRQTERAAAATWDLGEALVGIQVEGNVQEALELSQVGLLVASGWCSSWVAAGVPMAREGEEAAQMRASAGTGRYAGLRSGTATYRPGLATGKLDGRERGPRSSHLA